MAGKVPVRRLLFGVFGAVLWVSVFWALFQIANTQKNSAASIDDDDTENAVVPVLAKPAWSKDGLPDFQLVNQDGASVSKADLLGSPWIASFIFTECAGTCPRVSGQLKLLQNRLKGAPIRFVSFSVKPETDTPESLKRYADALGADSKRWHFLTGDKDVIFNLIRKGFLQYVAPANTPNPEPGWEVEHSNNACLVNAQGVVIGKYNSLDEGEVLLLRRDVERLVQDDASRR